MNPEKWGSKTTGAFFKMSASDSQGLRSLAPVKPPVPQIIHIGFSKCGSSYLRALFRAHPEINLVWKSGFFTPDLYTPNRARPRTLTAYRDLFVVRDGVLNVESDEHLTMPSVHPELGVRGTNIAEFEKLVARITDDLPGIKVIMVIRNQPALLVSRYSEYLIAGGALSFEQFVSALIDARDGGNSCFQNYYSEMISILKRHIPEENLLILAQEEMAADFNATAAQISSFLSIKELPQIKQGFLSERKSLSVAGIKVLRWVNRRLVRTASYAGAPPVTRCPLFIYQHVVRVIRVIDRFAIAKLSVDASNLLTGEARTSILRHFADDNAKLKGQFGLALEQMGYLETTRRNA